MKTSAAKKPSRGGSRRKQRKTMVEEVKRPKITIGPPKLTRFERARIIGARALQLALGAPPFIQLKPTVRDPISIAMEELELMALPISIRRTLPDGTYQDIPIDWLLQ